MNLFIKNLIKGDPLLVFYAKRIKNIRYDLNDYGEIIKVNLGCGLKVCKGYINIDYNIPTLFANCNTTTLVLIYFYLKLIRYSELSRPHRFKITKRKFLDIIKKNKFIFFSLANGIPFNDNSVDYYYSSHMIGFAFPKNTSQSILTEMFRTLKHNGLIRLSLTDGDHYWNKREKKISEEKYNTNDNCFTYNEILILLKTIGFNNIKKMNYGEGNYPDIKTLDDYTPEIDMAIKSKTMYLEVSK